MVSAKMYELGTKKSTIRTIFEFGRQRAAQVGEENIFDFSLGNPNVPTPDFVRDAAVDILRSYPPTDVHGYTVAPGNPRVRETIAESLNKRFDTHFAGKNIFITSGAAAAITICFSCHPKRKPSSSIRRTIRAARFIHAKRSRNLPKFSSNVSRNTGRKFSSSATNPIANWLTASKFHGSRNFIGTRLSVTLTAKVFHCQASA